MKSLYRKSSTLQPCVTLTSKCMMARILKGECDCISSSTPFPYTMSELIELDMSCYLKAYESILACFNSSQLCWQIEMYLEPPPHGPCIRKYSAFVFLYGKHNIARILDGNDKNFQKKCLPTQCHSNKHK